MAFCVTVLYNPRNLEMYKFKNWRLGVIIVESFGENRELEFIFGMHLKNKNKVLHKHIKEIFPIFDIYHYC